MSAAVIRFDTGGTGHCLYTELVDLKTLGTLDICRASNIKFNQQAQEWEVWNPEGKLLYSNASRSVCLAWEQQYFNR